MEQNNVQLIYINTDSLLPLIKIDDFSEAIKQDFEERYETSSYYERRRKRPLPVGKKQNSNRFDEKRDGK